MALRIVVAEDNLLVREGLVRLLSTGPDVDKIFHTLRFFGPRYRYVITAYPPFLKHLLDEAETRGFEWDQYRIHGIVAGEGMSEGLRTYLEQRFRTVWSGYGASDLALEPDLDRYYYESVIGGPGAFVVAAQSYETFADAILKMLIIEIAAPVMQRIPDPALYDVPLLQFDGS